MTRVRPTSSGAVELLPPTATVRLRMQRTRQRGNLLERTVSSALHKAGLRFRRHYRPVPGVRSEADIAFTRQRLAVQILGCFWHSCPLHATNPKRNAAWWSAKLAANTERDARMESAFEEAGWSVLKLWEHEPVEDMIESVQAALASTRPAHSRPRRLSPTNSEEPLAEGRSRARATGARSPRACP